MTDRNNHLIILRIGENTMKNIEFKTTKDVTTTLSLENYVLDLFTPAHEQDKKVTLISYNSTKDTYKNDVVAVDYNHITNTNAFRCVVITAFYATTLSFQTERMEKIAETLKDPSELTENQYIALKEESSRLSEYISALEKIVEYTKTPIQFSKDVTTNYYNLAENDIIAKAIAATSHGHYPEIGDMNACIIAAKAHYEIKDNVSISKETQKQSYIETRKALEAYCNKISFQDTIYSESYNNHANATLTNKVINEIVGRYYKGRTKNNKTGRIVQSYDTKGQTMKKELILSCLEKFQK